MLALRATTDLAGPRQSSLRDPEETKDSHREMANWPFYFKENGSFCYAEIAVMFKP